MIHLNSLSQVKNTVSEFDVVFGFDGVLHKRRVKFDAKNLGIKKPLVYLTSNDTEFMPFMRNNPKFTRKLVELIKNKVDGKPFNLPVSLPLEWREKTAMPQAA